MSLQVNQLVLTQFGYGTLVYLPPQIQAPVQLKSSNSVQESSALPIDNSEIQVKLQKIESEQKQQEQEQFQEQSQPQSVIQSSPQSGIQSELQSALQSEPQSAVQSEPPSLAEPRSEYLNSPEPPKAPSLDPQVAEQLIKLPSARRPDSPEDSLPFPNLGIGQTTPPPPLPPPPIPQNLINEKKPPYIIQLSNNLNEAIQKVNELKNQRILTDQRIAQVKLKCDAQLYIPVNQIKTSIYILIKTFFGNRNYYCAYMPIGTQIKQLVRLLAEGTTDNPKMLHNIRLIYPIGGLTELKDHNQTISDINLFDQSIILMLSQMTFSFDPNRKGKAINLSNNNCVALKTGESDYETVLGTLPMSSGRHYWEIRVEKFVDEEDIFIGIARKEIDLYSHPTTTGQFWGYVCLCGRKVGPNGLYEKYGYSVKQNDVIGVLLEFKRGVGYLQYYCNGSKCGDAFTNLTGIFYPAVSMFYGEVQVSLDPKAAFPMN